MFNGTALREAAAFHVAAAPAKLGHILQDKLETTRNKIEAYKALEKTAAGNGSAAEAAGRDHFTITIITGQNADQKMVGEIPQPLPDPSTLEPITIPNILPPADVGEEGDRNG
jgi:hypothetical protein